ncbi:hypothetical protein WJX73_009776 [Symbiochloris irregularis]|uniref:Protein SirB1 N-terminal domain-containing protein n=1 Tax=Symbiochloris irregularis TaxID=706552 RepID=A0AAW1P2S2_9CHLO
MISTQPCNPFSRRALGSNICHRNCFSLRLSGRKAHSPARALETPTEPIELAQWASSRFEEEADLLKDRPLVERCMLVALEEEASETAFGLSMSRQPPADRDKRHVLRPGNPRDAQMHRVLEDGTGCPVALAILYKEVCARLSVHMEIRVMERGQHALLWPKNCKRLQIDGKPLVIDIVNGGTLVLAEKVPGLELPLEASDDCSILEGLLEALRTAYWCQAVGCTPDQPIETTVQAAVEDFVQPMSSSYDLLRSAAAINKMAALMSYDRGTCLALSLVYYFSAKFDTAVHWMDAYLSCEERSSGVYTTETPDPAFLDELEEKQQFYIRTYAKKLRSLQKVSDLTMQF